MLVLTQMAVGALAFDVALRASGSARFGWMGSAIAAATGVLALLASTLHLGRPLYAFRAVLGISHSWLSREIVAFTAFAAAAPIYALTGSLAVGLGALVAGMSGVACSVMLYAVTRRTWWRPLRSTTTFVLSGAITGGTATCAWLAATGATGIVRMIGLLVAAAAVIKLVADLSVLRHRRAGGTTDLSRAALLLRRDLWDGFQLRLLLLSVGGAFLPVTVRHPVALVVATSLVVSAELIERNHFFMVAVAPRMPGELT